MAACLLVAEIRKADDVVQSFDAVHEMGEESVAAKERKLPVQFPVVLRETFGGIRQIFSGGKKNKQGFLRLRDGGAGVGRRE